MRWIQMNNIDIWFKPLNDGDFAFCFLNRGIGPAALNMDLKTGIQEYRIDDSYSIRDLWAHKDMGTTAQNVVATIPGHGSLLIRLTKK